MSYAVKIIIQRSVATLLLLFVVPSVQAFSNLLSDFSSQYPSSQSDNAGCLLCHGGSATLTSGSDRLNEYGHRYRLNGHDFGAIEGDSSVNINSGSTMPVTTMRDEINAGTQPGWTSGANNALYDTRSTARVSSNQFPPSGIGVLDPPGLTASAGGPYTATAAATIPFDGRRSADPDDAARQST